MSHLARMQTNKQNVYEINVPFILFSEIDISQIDVRNETSKHHFLKSNNPAFGRECSSPFQGTAASRVWLTTAHGQLYRSYKLLIHYIKLI